MGMSGKQVSGDQGQSGTAEMSKPLSIRRQQPEKQSEPIKCPRCSSSNTKFCYYNNYNKSQPRHFCKSCKRHWTKGGTLRNVPVGGGRKNKRPKISKAAVATTSAATVPVTAPALRQQDFSSFPLVGIPTGMNATAHRIIPIPESQFSSLSNFDMNASLNPALYHQPCDHLAGNLDSLEESTVTNVNIPGGSDAGRAGPESVSTMELPNYWNWNDIDVLISGDLSISCDDQDNAVIKR